MIIGECKIGNTIIRCDDSCIVRDPKQVEQIKRNIWAIFEEEWTKQALQKMEAEKKEVEKKAAEEDGICGKQETN